MFVVSKGNVRRRLRGFGGKVEPYKGDRGLSVKLDRLPTSHFSMAVRASVGLARLNQNSGNVLTEEETSALIAELTADGTAVARADVLLKVAKNALLDQHERNRAFVLMQYFGYLRRNPNDAPDSNFGSYDFWLNKLDEFNGNFIEAEMVKAFLSSSEYRRRFDPRW